MVVEESSGQEQEGDEDKNEGAERVGEGVEGEIGCGGLAKPKSNLGFLGGRRD